MGLNSEERMLWARFIAALEAVHDTDSDEKRRRFLHDHRSQLVLLSYWLNRLRVTGTEVAIAVDPPECCDQCGVPLERNGLFIDGMTSDTRWSYMCMPCFARVGCGIGWGVGQLYRLHGFNDNSEPRWLCIAGGNPDP